MYKNKITKNISPLKDARSAAEGGSQPLGWRGMFVKQAMFVKQGMFLQPNSDTITHYCCQIYKQGTC